MKQLKVIWIFFVMGSAQAQTTFGSLEDAWACATTHHARARIWESQASRDELAAKNAPGILLPQVKAFGQFDDYVSLPVQLIPAEIFGGEPGTFREVQFGTQYQLNMGLEASLPLINTQAWNRVKTEKLQVELGAWQRATARQQWKEQLARAYYLTLLSTQALDVSTENLEASDSILRLSTRQYQQGLLEPLAWHRLKAAHQQAQSQHLSNQQTAAKNQLALKQLCGLPESEVLTLSETLEAVNEPAETEYAISSLPQWRQSQVAAELSATRTKASRQAFAPTLSAIGRYSQQAWSNDLRMSSYNWFDVGLIGLRLEWSLFSGNQRLTQAKMARYDQEVAILEQERINGELEEEKARLLLDYATAKKLLAAQQEAARLHRENYALATRQLAEGMIGVSDLLQVQQELWASQATLLNLQAELYTTAALLQLRSEF